MNEFLQWVELHAQHAHYALFGAALLAGLNVPISIDLLMIISAVLAATIIPSHLLHLFLAMFIGCALSAWLAYWMGRLVGPKLLRIRFISKVLSPKRMKKIRTFYDKKGSFALILGRFIPFGVRNGLYMTSGMSKMSFPKFILWEGIACSVWSLATFTLYYNLGKNIPALYSRVKMINILIFAALSVTVIGIIWYKKKKNTKEGNV